MKWCFQLAALILIGWIVVIVYSPFMDLPLTVHPEMHPGALQSGHALPMASPVLAESLPSAAGFRYFRTPAVLMPEVLTITCAYLC